jgi:hypothetical protein
LVKEPDNLNLSPLTCTEAGFNDISEGSRWIILPGDNTTKKPDWLKKQAVSLDLQGVEAAQTRLTE